MERNFDCVAKQSQRAKTALLNSLAWKMTEWGRTCQNYLNTETEIIKSMAPQ